MASIRKPLCPQCGKRMIALLWRKQKPGYRQVPMGMYACPDCRTVRDTMPPEGMDVPAVGVGVIKGPI